MKDNILIDKGTVLCSIQTLLLPSGSWDIFRTWIKGHLVYLCLLNELKLFMFNFHFDF